MDYARAVATTICEQSMTQRLRAPASADYAFGHVANVREVGTNRYQLASYVDAQNGFGATLRTHFICTVEGQGESISGYRVTDLTVAK